MHKKTREIVEFLRSCAIVNVLFEEISSTIEYELISSLRIDN